ncbi:ricin-type beta-trefoil lectin domain protein [Streptomyces tauricus]|uniref:ricin-type beta-trefoil lectin domain protein n=1 Tax=Streptomyces tauricus TaxID=68274 RepID=UPI00167A3A3D|nr:ricin-type beta-trefoil lectin domain protein [Streptomyces tauricus]
MNDATPLNSPAIGSLFATTDARLAAELRKGSGRTPARYPAGELLGRHWAPVFSYARLCTNGVQYAGMLATAAFTRLFGESVRQVGPRAAWRPELLVAVRRTAGEWGADKRRGMLCPELRSAPDDGDSAAGRLLPPNDRRLVSLAFQRLPEAARCVLWHAEVEAEELAVPARLLGLTVADASQALERARELLRQYCLEAHRELAPDDECRRYSRLLDVSLRRGGNSVDPDLRHHMTDCEHCPYSAEQLDQSGDRLAVLLAEGVLGWAAHPYLASRPARRPGGEETTAGPVLTTTSAPLPTSPTDHHPGADSYSTGGSYRGPDAAAGTGAGAGWESASTPGESFGAGAGSGPGPGQGHAPGPGPGPGHAPGPGQGPGPGRDLGHGAGPGRGPGPAFGGGSGSGPGPRAGAYRGSGPQTGAGRGPGGEPGSIPGPGSGSGFGSVSVSGSGGGSGSGPGPRAGSCRGAGTQAGAGRGLGGEPRSTPGSGGGPGIGAGPSEGSYRGPGPQVGAGRGPGREPGSIPGSRSGPGPGPAFGGGSGSGPGSGEGSYRGSGPQVGAGYGPGGEPRSIPAPAPAPRSGSAPGLGSGSSPGPGSGRGPGAGTDLAAELDTDPDSVWGVSPRWEAEARSAGGFRVGGAGPQPGAGTVPVGAGSGAHLGVGSYLGAGRRLGPRHALRLAAREHAGVGWRLPWRRRGLALAVLVVSACVLVPLVLWAGGGDEPARSSGAGTSAAEPSEVPTRIGAGDAGPGRLSGRLRNQGSGDCAGIADGKVRAGAEVVLATCTASERQQWSYESDGLLRSLADKDLCLDSRLPSSVRLGDCDGDRNRAGARYDFTPEGNLVPLGQPALTLAPVPRDDATGLVLTSRDDGPAQRWEIDPSVDSLQMEWITSYTDGDTKGPVPTPAVEPTAGRTASPSPEPKPTPSEATPPPTPRPTASASGWTCYGYYCWYDGGSGGGYGGGGGGHGGGGYGRGR